MSSNLSHGNAVTAFLTAFFSILLGLLIGYFVGDHAGEERMWQWAARERLVEFDRQTGKRQLKVCRIQQPRPLSAGQFSDPPGGGAWLSQPLGSDR